MRVLFVVGFYPEIGGPFTAIRSLLKKISERGVSARVVSPIPKGYDVKKLDFIKDLPAEVIYVEEELPRYIMPSFSLKFFDIIRQEAKNVNLIYLAGLFDFYGIAVWKSEKPYIYGTHGTFMKDAYEMKKFKKIKKEVFLALIGNRILRKARRIHVKTEEERVNFVTYFPQFENKVVVIPNGIELENQDGHESYILNTPQTQNKKVVLFLGRLNWIKGLDILLLGFSRLKKEVSDIHLVIAGRDDGDGYEKTVKAWVKKHGLEKDVTFTGFVQGKEKIGLLRRSDVLIMPSYSENFGIVAIEGMAHGLPVIVSSRIGIVQEIAQWKAGIIIEPTAEGVYRGLKDWLSMENEELESMKKRAKKMIRELYDLDKVADRMVQLFREVVENG
ncbi:MAG: glycosyltransferase family 4 protein [Deltaproteobacteria bacterium]|nr:glycosyltransferase family 4 protein [Deltaproteobacteria bacterium]